MTAKTSNKRGAEGADNATLERGMALHKKGDLAGAEQQYRKVNRRNQGYAEALRLRGLLAHQQGDAEQAVKLIRRAVERQRSNPVFHHTLAQAQRANKQLGAAIVSYRRAWKLLPERGETGMDLARVLAEAGRVDEAVATWRQLLSTATDPGYVHTRIAKLYYQHGYPQAARETIAAWRAQAANDARSWYELGRAYVTIRQPAAAIDCYRQAVAKAPDDVAALAGLGSALQLHGEHEEADRWLEQALTLQPDLGWVYTALATDRNHAWTPQRRATLERLAADASVAETERMHMQFALGTLLDREGAQAQAFAHFEQGNRMHARRYRFDPDEFEGRVERMMRLFDRSFFEQRVDHGVASEQPLFIVGMPRSGTSLVEQIIASHPQAYGAGELEQIGSLVRELPTLGGGNKVFPATVAGLDKVQSRAWAQRYLDVLADHDGAAARVTDKMPMNFLWLGLIALLFPNARVIWCRRDALDNCLSCYFQIFHDGLVFSYDQQHLGRVYRQHERLMAHWAECLPLKMMTVDYETLVANQEAESRRLIEFAGLPWDDRCLAFHKTRRDVQTASAWQVRQPMYQSSVARWRAYEQWLGPLRENLSKSGDGG